jgi:hypothetical protein
MDYKRIAQLYTYLDEEYKKTPVNQARIDEINFYLNKEFGGQAPKAAEGSFWTFFDNLFSWFFPLPPNWKIWVTTAIGVFIAFNSQMHVVPQNWQDALLAVAVSLGFWAVNSTQVTNYKKLNHQFAALQKKQP